ncbi:MAG: ISAs1 family transposase [Verrucomicrobiaceae bacterium]|nr:MAG: ISAs1 family transposase [Verrucomicrobiaceae bacterium]
MASKVDPSIAQINLISILRELPDPRVDRTKYHLLEDILVIAICTLLCGGESFEDMEVFGEAKEEWFRTFLKLPHGIPSHDTFNRLFAALDPEKFLEAFMRWTESLRKAVAEEIVALDGKALRRALDTGECPKVIVSAWAAGSGLVLGQRKVDDKSNEITAVPELLRTLELSGCIVTLDAMGCQKQIAREIVEADADYVLALKGNQGTAHEEIRSYLDEAIAAGRAELQSCEHVDKGHGRIEVRRYWQSTQIDWFADRGLWEGLRSVGVVESMREIDGKQTFERRYYLSSLELDAERFARAVRGHWGVENQLHWVLDVVFNEDQSRARTGYAAENLALLRKWSLNLIKADKLKAKNSLKGRRKAAGWDNRYLLHLLGLTPILDA